MEPTAQSPSAPRRYTRRSHRALVWLVAGALGACGGADGQRGDKDAGADTSLGEVTQQGAPHVTIDQPSSGAGFQLGDTVTLLATVTHPSERLTDLVAVWTTDRATQALATDHPDAAGRLTLDIDSLAAGAHVITVIVTDSGGDTASASVNLRVDAPPSAPTVAITPAAPSTLDALTASVTGDAVDPDAAPLSYRYAWLKDGAPAGYATATVPAAATSRGETWHVNVYASDGRVEGPAGSAEVTIANAAPSCAGVIVSPASGDTTADFTCRCADRVDADAGDPVADQCRFTVDGEDIGAGEGACTLAATDTARGMEVTCTLTPSDGEAAGAPADSASFAILDSAPTAPAVALTPAAGDATTELTCAVTTPSTDADGDMVTYAMSWLVNGAADETAAGPTAVAGGLARPGGGTARRGDAVACRVTASDGAVPAAPVTSAALTLGNATPTVGVVTLRTQGGQPAREGETLVCESDAVTDADGDALTQIAAWTVSAGLVAGETGVTLSSEHFDKGDVVACALSASDGTATSAPVNSKNALTVQNTPPVIATATLSPEEASRSGSFSCAWSGWLDADGDAAQVAYAWYLVAGEVMTAIAGQTSDTLSASGLAADARVVCAVTPMNGDEAGESVVSGEGHVVSTAPVVAVSAPQGAEGVVTCEIVTAADGFDQPTYRWSWRVNGAAEVEGAQTLDAAAVASCDLLACRVEVSDSLATLSSNTAELQLPLGADCEDGDDCTSHVCDPAGGCAAPVLEDAIPCRVDDPCRSSGVCVSGVCETDADLCVLAEEPINIAIAGEPRVAGTLDGGYVVQWTPGTAPETRLRVTDASDSRRNEELPLVVATAFSGGPFPPAHPPVTPAATGDGGFAAAVSGGSLYQDDNWDSTNANAVVDVHVYKADGTEPEAAASLYSVSAPCTHWCGWCPNWYSNCCLGCQSRISGLFSQPLELADGLALIVSAVAYTKSPRIGGSFFENYDSKPVALVPVAGDQAGTPATLVDGARLNTGRRVAVTALPSGSDSLAVTWVGPGDDELRVQRFVKGVSGVTAGDEVLVRTGEGKITTPRIASFYDGSFIVGWTEASATNGAEAYVQRFDSGGNTTGAAIGVNAVQTGDQTLGGLDTFFDFGFVAVYTDSRADGANDSGIVARLFSASGTPADPIAVNTTTAGVQQLATVATVADDDWLVAWVDVAASGVMTRRFDRDGAPLPGLREQQPAENINGDQARIDGAASKQGNVLVAWDTTLFPGQDTEIAARLLAADGSPLGPEQLLNTTTADAQRTPVVAGGDDRFVVAWESLGEDGSGYGIYAVRLDGDGEPLGAPFRVNDTTVNNQLHPAIAMRADGSFLIAWDGFVSISQKTDVYVKGYDTGGAVIVGETPLNTFTAGEQERSDVAVDPVSGAFVVAWQSRNQVAADSGYDIFSRTVSPTATPSAPTLGPARQLNTTTAGDQKEVSVGVSPSGYLAACWEDGAPDLTCQTFTAATMIVKTAEFAVATITAGAQQNVVVAHASDGKLLVAWESDGVDRDGRGIQVRHFSAQGPASGVRVLGNRFTAGDQMRPFLVPLTGGRYLLGWQSAGQDGDGQSVVVRSLDL